MFMMGMHKSSSISRGCNAVEAWGNVVVLLSDFNNIFRTAKTRYVFSLTTKAYNPSATHTKSRSFDGCQYILHTQSTS